MCNAFASAFGDSEMIQCLLKPLTIRCLSSRASALPLIMFIVLECGTKGRVWSLLHCPAAAQFNYMLKVFRFFISSSKPLL